MNLNIVTLPQRRRLIESEVKRMNISAVYWPSIPHINSVTSISNSHKQIVAFAKKNGLHEIAIAEDDVLFTSINSWNFFLQNKPNDFDIYLGGVYMGIPFPDNTLYSFCGMHLYIIHERFYDQFLLSPENKSIDRAQDGAGKFVLCNPLVAKQRNGYSFHRKAHVNDDKYLKGMKFLID